MNNMKLMKKVVLGSLMLLVMLSACTQQVKEEGWKSLLDKDLSQWRIYQSYVLTNDFRGKRPVDADGNEMAPIGFDKNLYGVFTMEEEDGAPVLHVQGKAYGCVISKEDYKNYHLRLKVKFGKQQWEPRIGKAQDSGLLYHSVGEPGADYWLSWMRSFEYQVMQSGTTEGNSGDFWSIAGSRADIKASKNEERDAWFYDPDGEWRTFSGFCGTKDYNSPEGEWTTLELFCFDDKSVHVVNGHVSMALKNLRYATREGEYPLTAGKIQLQSEAGDIYYKDVEIREITELPAEYASLF